jgi:hypothetical protein
MNQRLHKLTIALFFLTLTVTQFQNCASDNPLETPTNSVPIVQDLANQKVAFVQSSVQLRDSAKQTAVDGLCAGGSAALQWAVVNTSSSQIIEQGQAECVSGSFQITLNKIAQIPCDQPMQLQVRSSAVSVSTPAAPQILELSRKCAPLLARQVGAQCFVELASTPATAINVLVPPTVCQQVCYQQAQVVVRRDLALSECKDLQP